LPGVTTLSRLVASVRERTATRLWRRLAALPSAEQQAQLDALLEIPQSTRYSRLLISIQVLQEMYVNVTRKIPQPLSLAAARGLVNLYRVWQVGVPSVETLLHASEIQDRNQLSCWDAMIVATAVQGGAEVLLSEDLNHGQVIEGIQITNPFAH
jgi:predicted nucleic acid-binding protein